MSGDTTCVFSCVFSQGEVCDGTTGAGADRGATEPIIFWFVFTASLVSRGFIKPGQNCTLLRENGVHLHLLKL